MPLKMHCYLFPFYVALFLSCCFNMGRGNDTDEQALMEFKAKIIGDNLGVMRLWNDTVHFCQWYGVTCSHRRQRVTKLDLPSLKLLGTLSPFIGNLSFLKVLNLQNNSFSHAIPQEFRRLHRLRELRLYNNSFDDKLPSNISRCSKLEIFDVGNNLLGGEIPSMLGYLSHLKKLHLHKNNFIGSIPHSLGNLSALESLALFYNNLSGHIPESLGELENLTYLSLGWNKISGIIPPSIFNLSNIRTLEIGRNQLQGNLPSNLGITMPYIEYLSVAANQIIGSIPISISNASNLFFLQISQTNLSGSLPSFEKLDKLTQLNLVDNNFGSGGVSDLSFLCSLTNATSLWWLGIGANNFGGPLPNCISNFSSIQYLVIEYNKIFGRIPVVIENLINLEVLAASGNMLSGSIPHGIGRLQKLKVLYAEDNSLSGAIPISFGNITTLIQLDLTQNSLQGNIPSHLGMCKNLLRLGLGANNLTGSIPPAVMGLSSLSTVLDLSSNHLTGMLPIEVGNLENLGVLDVSSNKLSGMLPDNLGRCVGLNKLNLAGNLFQGNIPSSLSSLRGLEELDISWNNISGEIPNYLVSFESLRYLNLSFNDLEGALPTDGVFKNASATFVQGNNKLCGGALEFHLPRCHLKASKSRTNSFKLKFAIGFAILGMILVFSFLLLSWFRKKKEQPITANCAESSLLKLSYQSILKATDGFSSEKLIGSGSFSSVYKGILEESGVAIAVKVFNLSSHEAPRSFIAECEALKNIRHRNLVKILTAISGVDYQGNDFKALVYEFMQKGSLEDWLHPSVNLEQGRMRHLTLFQRVNVAIHVASALEYLHHQCETPIVHCDLKPSNILLDDEMVAHVADFGLAKLLATEMPNHSNQSSSLGLRGTIGYAPPEYGLGSEVSTKGDVYSYGILLLEMFTGKRPTNEMFKGGLSLHNFVMVGLPKRLHEVLDPILLLQQVHDKHFQYLNSILEIGIACCAESLSERMDMIDVAAKLCSIRDKLICPARLHP